VAADERQRFLLIRIAGLLAALPLESVIETMRPLPVEPISGVPPFIRGLAVIRGEPIPVVDLGLLLRGNECKSIQRYVTLRVGEKCIALAVEDVVQVRDLNQTQLEGMPALLGDAENSPIQSAQTLDQNLVLLLRASRIISDDIWVRLSEKGFSALPSSPQDVGEQHQ